MTMAKAVEQEYMKEAVIEQFGDHLTAYMEEKEVSHREEVQALAEQRREEAVRTTSAKFKAKQKEDLEARTRRVPEEPKGPPPRKAFKLPKGTEDQKKAERAEAARKARENADAASRALSGGQPHMLEPPNVTLRDRRERREEKVEEDRRAKLLGEAPAYSGHPNPGARQSSPGGGFSYGGRGGTFLDNISALGSDDPYGADQSQKPPRGPGRGGPGGGGGGSPPKDRGQKRRRTSPGGRGNLEGILVVIRTHQVEMVRKGRMMTPGRKRRRRRRTMRVAATQVRGNMGGDEEGDTRRKTRVRRREVHGPQRMRSMVRRRPNTKALWRRQSDTLASSFVQGWSKCHGS